MSGLDTLPRVEIVSDYTGSDGSILADVVARRPDGIVVVTFAGGRMSAGTQAGVRAATAAGLPVVLASRIPGGRIVGQPAERFGALQTPDLPAHKARILLMLALTRTSDPVELQTLLDRY